MLILILTNKCSLHLSSKNHFFQLKITIEIQNEWNFRKQLTIWCPSSIDTSPTKTLILRHVEYTRKREYRKNFSSQRIRTSTMTKYLLSTIGVLTEILRIWSQLSHYLSVMYLHGLRKMPPSTPKLNGSADSAHHKFNTWENSYLYLTWAVQ